MVHVSTPVSLTAQVHDQHIHNTVNVSSDMHTAWGVISHDTHPGSVSTLLRCLSGQSGR